MAGSKGYLFHENGIITVKIIFFVLVNPDIPLDIQF
jgi:hypothetical protein